jgi:hypothetical protein
MIVFKRKTRMVSFRISEEEYEYLRQHSLAQGARSVSDYARDTLFGSVDLKSPGRAVALVDRMHRLDSEMRELNREVKQLRARLGPEDNTGGPSAN